MITHRDQLTAEVVRELLDYDPETGLFTWRPRDQKWFPSERSCRSWNTKHAGKPAFATAQNSSGYLCGEFFDMQFAAHRVAFLYVNGRWPDDEVDHENRVCADNRSKNLREATRSQNQINRDLLPKNTTGVAGVWAKKDGSHAAFLGRRYLGRFRTLEAATVARKQAEQDLWAGREITAAPTMQNQGPRRTSTTGVVGVSPTANGNYAATFLGKHLGTFKTIEEAALARRMHMEIRA